MKITLEKPNLNRKDSYLKYVDECRQKDAELVPFVLKFPTDDFEAFLRVFEDCENGIGLPEGFVPHVTYWLVVDEEVVGVSNLRLRLTESLLRLGGHIGYGVKPSARRKGFATLMLRETLVKAKEYGIDPCMVTCNKENIASAKTILNNGGVLDSEEYLDEIKETIQRYWIKLKG